MPKRNDTGFGPAFGGTTLTVYIRRKEKGSARDQDMWETRHGWECGRGFDKAGLSQDPMAGARHRGSSDGPDGVIILKSRIPLKPY